MAWGKVDDQAKAVSEPLEKLKESGAVTCISRNDYAIAALKTDSSVVSWGNADDQSKVRNLALAASTAN